MKKPMRKPSSRVLSIKGEPSTNSPVTDEDYQAAIQKQAQVLQAQEEQRLLLERIRNRLTEGAPDAGRRYYFDFELGIVRRRERKEGAG